MSARQRQSAKRLRGNVCEGRTPRARERAKITRQPRGERKRQKERIKRGKKPLFQ